MTSILKVDTIQDTAGNNIINESSDTITIGASGDTITIPSGATISNLGTASGFPSDYVLLASTDASSVASVSFDGFFSSTYKNYKIIGSNITLNTGTNNISVRFRRSNADITASNYYHVAVRHYIVDAALSAIGGSGNSSSLFINENTSSASGYNSSFTLDLYDPLGTNNYKNATFITIAFDNGADNRHHFESGGLGLTDSTSALSGITFLPSANNILRGNFKLYGIK